MGGLQRRFLGLAGALVLVTGCASQPAASDAGARPASTGTSTTSGAGTRKPRPVSPMRRPAAGEALAAAYRAPVVSGDYAGYPELDRFIARMITEHGFSRDYLNGLFSQAERKDWTIEYMNRQAPSAGPPRPGAWSRYRAKFLTDRHIAEGAAFWRENASALSRAQERYGVPAEYLVGIIGVETMYGANTGNHRILDALTTLAFDYPRRGDYFRGELENYLLMTRAEGIDPLAPKGSFAGAMGLGQFMPGSFQKWAVDFDGDGRKDLWEPVDAVGSVANYFAAHGWHRGQPVVTPASALGARARVLDAGFDTRYSLGTLASHDIRPTGQVADGEDLRLLRLSGNAGDEYWLGHHNFYVITRYNHSTHYAMAVHQLAQAIKQRYRAPVVAQR
jgi:membrane-bound lytic murein transglycosylase B